MGYTTSHLREHLTLRRKFFDTKERLRKLKQLVAPDDNEHDLDRKMLAVVTKADQPELFNIVRTLFHSMTEGGEVDLEVIAPGLGADREIRAGRAVLGDGEVDLRLLGGDPEPAQPADPAAASPTLPSIWAKSCRSSLQHLQLPRSGTANAVVCLAQWRDSSSKASSYNMLWPAKSGAILHIED